MSSAAISALGIGATATPSAAASTAAASTGHSPTSFADALSQLVTGAEQSGDSANVAVNGMLDKSVDVHDAMIALQRAEMSLQLAVQVRNKLVQAYQDIMRMPV
jgi:flagellar hook-basal body complex protein FliE